jgi:hypothetical protein
VAKKIKTPKLPQNWGKVPGHEDVFPGKAETVLEEAARLTSGDRQRDYDHPFRNHQRIARLWNAYLDCRKEPKGRIMPEDVATMMILLKIARNVFTPKRDNLVDVCGYARCLEQIADYTEAVAENP